MADKNEMFMFNFPILILKIILKRKQAFCNIIRFFLTGHVLKKNYYLC